MRKNPTNKEVTPEAMVMPSVTEVATIAAILIAGAPRSGASRARLQNGWLFRAKENPDIKALLDENAALRAKLKQKGIAETAKAKRWSESETGAAYQYAPEVIHALNLWYETKAYLERDEVRNAAAQVLEEHRAFWKRVTPPSIPDLPPGRSWPIDFETLLMVLMPSHKRSERYRDMRYFLKTFIANQANRLTEKARLDKLEAEFRDLKQSKFDSDVAIVIKGNFDKWRKGYVSTVRRKSALLRKSALTKTIPLTGKE